MNQKVEGADRTGEIGLESGLEALRQSSAFHGPVEPFDDHEHSNDHLALVYENSDEQFRAAMPFVRQGLERGERCLYIADENSREEVLEALEAHGVDTDVARESGALSVHTKQDTYLRDGEFHPEEMIAFLEDAIADASEEYIEFAVDGADRMRAMVDDLLAYSRVEQADGEFEAVDCEAVFERVVDDLQVRIEDNDAEVVADSLPTVTADSEQLEQLFRNLVSNGIKYSSDEPARVEVTAEQRADCWEFSVADNGIGIDPEKTDRIFEVFKRLHHDDEYSGTGIGLALCQEIVENHGGDIWVDSEPGDGSTFSFTLPSRSVE